MYTVLVPNYKRCIKFWTRKKMRVRFKESRVEHECQCELDKKGWFIERWISSEYENDDFK